MTRLLYCIPPSRQYRYLSVRVLGLQQRVCHAFDDIKVSLQAMEDDEEEEEKQPKKAKPKYVVSGGLTGFGVAQDLLHVDFSPPEEAPEEFRAVPFNEKRVTTLRSGKSGDHLLTKTRHAEGLVTASCKQDTYTHLHSVRSYCTAADLRMAYSSDLQ